MRYAYRQKIMKWRGIGMANGISAIRPARQALSAAPAAQKAEPARSFAQCLRAADKKTDKAGSLDSIFRSAAERFGVPENLLKAVAKAESGFRADAVSRCGAQGIMQLMPSTAAALGVTDTLNPEQNIMGGAKYLGQLLRRYGGDEELTLAAYNAGSGNVEKYGGIPPFTETQNYVRRVLAYAGEPLSAGGAPAAAADGVSAENEPSVEPSAVRMPELAGEDFRRFVELYIGQIEQDALDGAEKAKKTGRV
ncbi:MAG TPA: hypothetical protein DCL64_00040 [Ruminococcaceae bacterium]|nr:hypothetical protein [Oscillospiraceae bacterium]